jgi:F0F1-type ATP synthase membrane subunit b/b'
MTDRREFPRELLKHATNLRAAADFFEDFMGTDAEDHCENLREAADQFCEDANEYAQYLKEEIGDKTND